MPRVTIVTPTYNAARFVRECVESVLAQTFTDWELVVVDDGSTDGTPEIVESVRDPRVRCIRLPHRGLRALAETYNHALAASDGELVAVLEGDDYWPPEKLAVQVRGFDDPAVQLSWGAGHDVDASGRFLRLTRRTPVDGKVHLFSNGTVFRQLLRSYVLCPSVTIMLRRSALDRIGGFRQDGTAHYVDLPTCLLVLAKNPGVSLYHGHVLGSWRRYSSQTTQRYYAKIRRERWRVVREVARQLEPAERVEVGWTAELERYNWARWIIGCGRAALRSGRYDRARKLHLAVLAQGPGIPVRVKALSGIASATFSVDLPTLWHRLADRR